MDPHATAQTPPLVIETTPLEGQELVVRISGELDLLTHGALARALDAAPVERVGTVRLQLSQLTFCDSCGLRQLLTFVRDGQAAGRQVTIDQPSPLMHRLFSLFAPWALEHVRIPSDAS